MRLPSKDEIMKSKTQYNSVGKTQMKLFFNATILGVLPHASMVRKQMAGTWVDVRPQSIRFAR